MPLKAGAAGRQGIGQQRWQDRVQGRSGQRQQKWQGRLQGRLQGRAGHRAAEVTGRLQGGAHGTAVGRIQVRAQGRAQGTVQARIKVRTQIKAHGTVQVRIQVRAQAAGQRAGYKAMATSQPQQHSQRASQPAAAARALLPHHLYPALHFLLVCRTNKARIMGRVDSSVGTYPHTRPSFHAPHTPRTHLLPPAPPPCPCSLTHRQISTHDVPYSSTCPMVDCITNSLSSSFALSAWCSCFQHSQDLMSQVPMKGSAPGFPLGRHAGTTSTSHAGPACMHACMNMVSCRRAALRVSPPS